MHDRDLPAAVAAGPTVAPIATTFAGEYTRVNWRAAGSLPVGDVKERLREAVPPEDTTLDAKTSVSVCPKESAEKQQARMTATANLDEMDIIQIHRPNYAPRIALTSVIFRLVYL